MKVLGLIPARGGSKRLPGKNTKVLGGLPLIAWTIRSARESQSCSEVLVSTDDQDIADIARQYGASVPWLRPAELATDSATSVDVSLHALDAFEHEHGPVDALLLLQPTSPFRTAEAIREALALFESHGKRHSVASLSREHRDPAWYFRVRTNRLEPVLGWEPLMRPPQEREPAWVLNGSIYVISPSQLREERRFLNASTRPLCMDRPEDALDIDTFSDWQHAQRFLEEGT